MTPIQTKTGSKIHILEPQCTEKNYAYSYHPLCMGGKNRMQYKNIAVKKLPSSSTITCKRCIKITKIDTDRFSTQENFQLSTNEHSPTTKKSSSNLGIYISLILGLLLFVVGIWGILSL